MDKEERDDENIPQETAEGTGGKNEKEEVDGEEARVKKLLALECCPKRCLQSQPELVEAVVASLAHMSTKEKKISLLTALAVSSKMKEAKGLDGRERIRFAYCLPLLGEVCRPAFAACYDVSGATLARYRCRVVENVFFPKEHGLKGNNHAAFIDTKGIVIWLREFAATVGEVEAFKGKRKGSKELKTCTWLPAEYTWEKLRLEYVKTLPEGTRLLCRRSFERIARENCSDIRIRSRDKVDL